MHVTVHAWLPSVPPPPHLTNSLEGQNRLNCPIKCTVSLVPTSTHIGLKRAECGSAESNMLHMRHRCMTFLFFSFSLLECSPDEAYLTHLRRVQLPWVKWELRAGPGLQCGVYAKPFHFFFRRGIPRCISLTLFLFFVLKTVCWFWQQISCFFIIIKVYRKHIFPADDA